MQQGTEPTYIKVIHDDQNPVLIPVIAKEDCANVYTLSLEFLKSCLEDAPITALMTDEDEPKYLLMRDPGHIIELHDLNVTYKTRFKRGKC